MLATRLSGAAALPRLLRCRLVQRRHRAVRVLLLSQHKGRQCVDGLVSELSLPVAALLRLLTGHEQLAPYQETEYLETLCAVRMQPAAGAGQPA